MENTEFRVGAASAPIPFPENFFPYRAWGPRCLTGVHDDLCVRAIYLQSAHPVLFAAVEAGDIDPAWNGSLAVALGLDPDQIFLSATHTHTAPYIGGYWPENVRDVEKSAQFTAAAWDVLVAVAKKAMESPVPAQLHFGTGSCYINVNRDVYGIDPFNGEYCWSTGPNYHGPSDKTVASVSFSDLEGKPVAVLFSYAVHSSMLFGSNQKDGGQLASGDLAGAAMRHIEQELGNHCVALFAMAPAADQEARLSTSYMFAGPDGKPDRIDYGLAGNCVVDALSRELAAEVVSIVRNNTIPVSAVSSVAGTAMIPGKVKKEGPGVPPPRSPADYEPSDPVPVPVTLALLDDILIVGIGCECTTVIGAEIRSALQAKGFEKVLIITQCNGSSSYMADDAAYQKVTFTAKASHMMPGASACLVQEIIRLAIVI